MMVDGAVRDCFMHHPEYINRRYDEPAVRLSIVKRVTGQLYKLRPKRVEGARSAKVDRPPKQKKHASQP